MRASIPDFEMKVARELGEALELVSGGYVPFAGGTDIMVLFNAGKLTPCKFVSVRLVPELQVISETEDCIEIGAAVTYSEIQGRAGVRGAFPLLAQAACWIGGVANQNRGTLGGNISNASPAADSAPVLLAYEAQVRVSSAGGERWIPYREFHLGYKRTSLRAGEVIRSIRIERPRAETVHYGRKVGTRKAQAISKVSMAAVRDSGRYRIAVGSVAPMPLRCIRTEELLNGERLTAALVEEAKRVIGEEISPIDDIRSTGSYRRAVTQNLLGEFLESMC